MSLKITLDAGHGGLDCGFICQSRTEKEDNLNLVLSVGPVLSDLGLDVYYTRVSDIYETPMKKAELANLQETDYLISFHRNMSREKNSINGCTIYVGSEKEQKSPFVYQLQRELKDIGFQILGVQIRKDFALLRNTQMPSVVVSVGYLDSDIDNEIWEHHFEELTGAFAKAVTSVFGESEEDNSYLESATVDSIPPARRPGRTNRNQMNDEEPEEMEEMEELEQSPYTTPNYYRPGLRNSRPMNNMPDGMQGNDQFDDMPDGMPNGVPGNNQPGMRNNRPMNNIPNGMPNGVPENNQPGMRNNRPMNNQPDGMPNGVPENNQPGMRNNRPMNTLPDDNQDNMSEGQMAPFYTVQVGLYNSEERAREFAQPLDELGYPVRIVRRGPYYVILVGEYELLSEATELETDLKELGYNTLLIQD